VDVEDTKKLTVLYEKKRRKKEVDLRWSTRAEYAQLTKMNNLLINN
jgi:hypothetical protein